MPVERITRVHEVKDEQCLTLNNRKNLSITGANDVLAFSDSTIELDTNMGVLVIKGDGLRIVSVSTESNTGEVSGRITSLEYKKPREKTSLLQSLFK